MLRGDSSCSHGFRLYKGAETAKLIKRNNVYNFSFNGETYLNILSLIDFCRTHPELKKDPEQNARGLSKLHNNKVK